ncbi:MAG: hypothetical protein JMN25_09485 [gamma proteobacterium endosymbiont of Lamellibrachia anaximandri]|nr:hypothetical protein [gamma proteobacterium endosymbiont of Lamellibrachia anaximandri]
MYIEDEIEAQRGLWEVRAHGGGALGERGGDKERHARAQILRVRPLERGAYRVRHIDRAGVGGKGEIKTDLAIRAAGNLSAVVP